MYLPWPHTCKYCIHIYQNDPRNTPKQIATQISIQFKPIIHGMYTTQSIEHTMYHAPNCTTSMLDTAIIQNPNTRAAIHDTHIVSTNKHIFNSFIYGVTCNNCSCTIGAVSLIPFYKFIPYENNSAMRILQFTIQMKQSLGFGFHHIM